MTRSRASRELRREKEGADGVGCGLFLSQRDDGWLGGVRWELGFLNLPFASPRCPGLNGFAAATATRLFSLSIRKQEQTTERSW